MRDKLTPQELHEHFRHMHRWSVIENIGTMTAMILGCYFVSLWFLLLVFNINTPKIGPRNE